MRLITGANAPQSQRSTVGQRHRVAAVIMSLARRSRWICSSIRAACSAVTSLVAARSGVRSPSTFAISSSVRPANLQNLITMSRATLDVSLTPLPANPRDGSHQ